MLDDPFREAFNYCLDQEPDITVNINGGTNATLFTKVMPLILYYTDTTIQ